LVSDIEKGELRISGVRLTAINAQALCDYLDTLVGARVAEVIMHNLEFRLGKLDAAKLRAEQPKATLRELIERLARDDRLSGFGITKVALSENAKNPIEIEIENPSVRGSVGAAKAFAFSWWAGIFTAFLGKEMDVENFNYNKERNLIECQIVPRG
jgi:hypothetical protein